MKTDQILKLLEIAMNSAEAVGKLIVELKSQAGMTDDQLLAWAAQKDADTRAMIAKHLGVPV